MRRATTLFIVTALMLPVAALSAQAINDAQIRAIVVTANQVDIDAGKLADSSASDPQASPARSHGGRSKGDRSVAASEGVALCALESPSNFASAQMDERENNLAIVVTGAV